MQRRCLNYRNACNSCTDQPSSLSFCINLIIKDKIHKSDKSTGLIPFKHTICSTSELRQCAIYCVFLLPWNSASPVPHFDEALDRSRSEQAGSRRFFSRPPSLCNPKNSFNILHYQIIDGNQDKGDEGGEEYSESEGDGHGDEELGLG